MRFPNIDEVEIDAVFAAFVNFIHAPGMLTTRGSRMGPEDQRDCFISAYRELEHLARLPSADNRSIVKSEAGSPG